MLVVATLLALWACSGQDEPPRAPDIVLVVVDTLRADRLGFAGYPAARTPHFDALQRESIWFTRALSTSSWTIPAIGSLLLSKLPSQHGLVKWGSRMGEDETSVVELLKAGGYATGAWTANRLMGRGRGFAQGFDEYKMVLHPKKRADTKPGTEYAIAPASEVTRNALAWIAERRTNAPDDPIFVYVHYLEPHTPYLCPDGSDAACRSEAALLSQRLLFGDWGFDDREQQRIRELYDDELARMDDALGALLAGLTHQGLLDDGWLILVADHGEQLGEGGTWIHGLTLNQPVVHVPLLVRPPGGRAAVVDGPVSLLDVAPTLLDLAGVPIPQAFSGRSLLPAILGGSLEPRPVVLELEPKSDDPERMIRHTRAVIEGDVELLLSPDGRLERFDLTRDPAEEAPVSPSPMDFARLRALGIDVDSKSVPAPASTSDDVPPDLGEHLKALGYVR